MLKEGERARMLRAYSIGPRMIGYLEEIGIERLEDLAGAEVEEIAMRIDIAVGRKRLNRFGHPGAPEPHRHGEPGTRAELNKPAIPAHFRK